MSNKVCGANLERGPRKPITTCPFCKHRRYEEDDASCGCRYLAVGGFFPSHGLGRKKPRCGWRMKPKKRRKWKTPKGGSPLRAPLAKIGKALYNKMQRLSAAKVEG
jgi:hypothetical protein